MKKERKLIWIACATLLAVLGLSQTLAFFTTNVDSENLITFGNLDLKINETTLDNQGEEVAYSPDEKVNLSRNSHLSRIIRLENTGSQPMYVRVDLSITGQDKDGGEIKNADALAEYTLNEDDWVYKDGWYYYKDILEPGSESKELMTEIIFDINEISSLYPGGDFDLDVSAQGVQSKNNENENVLLVTGWPE